jgi:hypothetical protein
MKIKELKEIVVYNGYEYQLNYMTNKAYVYAQMLNHKSIAYEVFKKKLRSKSKYDDINTYDKYVVWPNDEAFGVWAWTYPTLFGAIDRLKSIDPSTTVLDVYDMYE